MKKENLNKKDILNIDDPNNNESQQKTQNVINNNNRYEEEFNIEQINEQNNEDNEQIIQNSDENNTENGDEKIIIENENEDLEDNNNEEIVLEENANLEENNNEEIVIEENEEFEEKELYNIENDEEMEEKDENNNFPSESKNNQNNNIKIEEYEPELNENQNEKSENKEEYILNKLAEIKNKVKQKVKNSNNNQENNNQFNNIEPINSKQKKLIYLAPAINSYRVEKKATPQNHKYSIHQEENKADKNILKNKKEKEKEGNYLYTKKNLKDKNTKFNYIKNFDKANNETDSNNLRRNIYNKSNDDIKRILNIDNDNFTPDNLLNYNSLMNIWRHRYSKRSHLYKKINSDFELNFKKENDNKMVKRTNSILRKASHSYASSLTDANDLNNILLNNNFTNSKRYRIPIYYNGIINRKYSNPLLKKNNLVSNLSNFNKYNPLLKARTNKNIFTKRTVNFTDILRAKLNNSDDFNKINEKQIERRNGKNKFLYSNNRYNYNTDNILKNNLYRKIVQTNREKEISKSNRIYNKGNKKCSIIKKNIFNIIKDTNNKKKRFKNPVLSLRANQLITSFNAEFKNETN